MKIFFEKLILFFLSLPGNPLKDAVRDVFYGDVVSERIFEYAAVLSHLGIEPDKKAKILDVGCYYSNFPLQLASLGYNVTAIDLQKYTLTHPNFKFILGDVTEYNFKKKFDVITCISTLEHIGLDVYGGKIAKRGDRKAIESMGKTLKKGGKLILTFPFGKSSQTSWYRSYSHGDLTSLLVGFLIEDIHYYKKMNGKWLATSKQEINQVNNKKSVLGVAVVVATKKI